MMKLLDSQDTSVNQDMPMLQGLTNGGPANLGIPMNLPPLEQSTSTNSGIFGSTPAMLGNLTIEDDDEWNDTDPMSFEDDQVYENFLGIRIGKKAKAKGAAKKAARVAKRAAKRAAKNKDVAEIGSDSPWKQPNEITVDNYNPLAVAPPTESPSLLSTINNVATTAASQLGLGNPNATGLTGFENLQNEFETGYEQEDERPVKKQKKNNTLLYVGIGAAVLIAVIVALKARK